jgi:hypothetical protein
MVPETSVIFNHLTRLIAREGFIFNRRESFKSWRVLASEIDLNIYHLTIRFFFRVFLKVDIIVNKIILCKGKVKGKVVPVRNQLSVTP